MKIKFDKDGNTIYEFTHAEFVETVRQAVTVVKPPQIAVTSWLVEYEARILGDLFHEVDDGCAYDHLDLLRKAYREDNDED